MTSDESDGMEHVDEGDEPRGLEDLLARNLRGEMHEQQPEVGMIIDGKWELLRLLGEGGFGQVYEAWHAGLDRAFAIKFLNARHKDPKVWARFLEEARWMATMTSEHLVRVSDFGELPDGPPYFVMELVQGETLRRRLRERMRLEDALVLTSGILMGLSEVHRRGVVHGDIKPENIMIGEDGKVRLLDFGLAKTLALAGGGVGGTPPYMAPELLLDSAEPSLRTDVYAVAAVLYEMLTARLPRGHVGMSFDKIVRSWLSKPKSDPVRMHRADVSEPLERLVMDALARAPDLRPESAQAMLERLRKVIDAGSTVPHLFRSTVTTGGARPSPHGGHLHETTQQRAGPARGSDVNPASGMSRQEPSKWRALWWVGAVGVGALGGAMAMVLVGLPGQPGEPGPGEEPNVAEPEASTRKTKNGAVTLPKAEPADDTRPPMPALLPKTDATPKPNVPVTSRSGSLPETEMVALTLPEGSRPMRLLRIEAGAFWMGSPEYEAGHDSDEQRHQVTLSRPFMMCETEVTQAQWMALMVENPGHDFNGHGDDVAVHGVSWVKAVQFLNALSRKQGFAECYTRGGDELIWERNCEGYRLPTEAEWEYATRAETETAYSHGDGVAELGEHAWYESNAGRQVQRVATKTANPWGLYDAHGNADEWVWDRYESDYGSQPKSDPTGPPTGDRRVLRGGSSDSSSEELRSAYRRDHATGNNYSAPLAGLRCARGPHPNP